MKEKIKKITYASIILTIVVVTIIIVAMIIKINNMYTEYKEQALLIKNERNNNQEDVSTIEDLEEASSSIGKTVEESQQEEKVENNVDNQEEEKTKPVDEKKEEIITKPVIIPDPTFTKPVDGEIIKQYSKDNLVYSETLKEWTTHTGVDIQANLTTVVKASAEGTVKAIKNDPRYGITVIIQHANEFETRYSNLLTAEFVVVGEKVAAGQTIGTVGNTASFEVADTAHLHFEILKNSEYLDPTVYIN